MTGLLDKGSRFVIMDKNDYITKMDGQLNNPLHYQRLEQDPTNLHLDKVKTWASKLLTRRQIPEDIAAWVVNEEAKAGTAFEVQPLERTKHPKSKITIMSRDVRPTKRLAMRTYLEEVNINSLISSNDTCDGKVRMLENVVNTGVNILLPLKKKTIHPNEPAWVNRKLKYLISLRQKALAQGDHAKYHALRNQVNRERKSCRAKFYESKVEQLKESKPATWWSEVKK
ncbi:hypothetical protein AC249_AIPGENE967 [Exaiptasia diaphana]|nr:hypothetical protein AC249_AIPGENE967 [Exaiptasia diaphana]